MIKSNIEPRRTRYEDFDKIELREEQKLFGATESLKSYAKHCILVGRAFTFEVDGKVLVISDVHRMADNKLYVWSLFAKHIGHYSLTIVRYAQRALRLFEGEPVYSHVLATDAQGHKLMKILKFRKVKDLPKFYDDLDFVLYVKE